MSSKVYSLLKRYWAQREVPRKWSLCLHSTERQNRLHTTEPFGLLPKNPKEERVKKELDIMGS